MNEMIDWNKFKSEAKGWNLSQAKKSYIELYELVNKNNHKLLTEYIGNSIKVLIDFNCGHKPHWIGPKEYKKGQGCPKCSGVCTKQVKEDLINLINKNGHKLLSEYINNKTKVLINFNCGHEPHWIRPSSYKRGEGCPGCSGLCPAQAKNDLLNMLKENNHKLLSEYVNAMTKVLIDFNCGHKPHWIIPSSYKKGTGCPRCSRKCSEQAKEKLLKMLNNNGHKLLSEYTNALTKVLIDFNCGHEPHWIRPYSYKNGQGCPKCVHKGERELYELLLNMNYKVETQKTYNDLKYKDYLKYDFYLPEYNLLIELDGDHHREKVIYKNKNKTELEKYLEEIKANERLQDRQYKDKLKNDYAKDNNIPLLRIKYVNSIVELDKWKKLLEDKIKEINFQQNKTFKTRKYNTQISP